MEILETFPRVFCFPKSRINENGGEIGFWQLLGLSASKGPHQAKKDMTDYYVLV